MSPLRCNSFIILCIIKGIYGAKFTLKLSSSYILLVLRNLSNILDPWTSITYELILQNLKIAPKIVP
jgi:hypothetical protein